MKIALFGATGRVGGEVLKRALADGHEVTALVRSPEKLAARVRLTLIQGDIRKAKDVAATVAGMDVVLSAIGTDKTTTLTEALPHILSAMKKAKISRIVSIGTAGILQSRSMPNKLRYQDGETKRRLTFAAEEHHKVYRALKESTLDWTIVCPTYLPDGEATGKYRVEKDYLPEDGKEISVGDTAVFAYEELHAKVYVKSRVGIAY